MRTQVNIADCGGGTMPVNQTIGKHFEMMGKVPMIFIVFIRAVRAKDSHAVHMINHGNLSTHKLGML